ncbi:hypothetical protein CCR80_12680 [Rhodothalassium salexigens]|nr:hypothetical protein [Rhodothalassium salexigens]
MLRRMLCAMHGLGVLVASERVEVRMTPKRLARLSAGLLAVGLLAACGEDPQGQTRQPPQVEVTTPLVDQVVEWDEYTGRFQAVKSVEVRARVSGYLESFHFTDGTMVDKGDLLFVIDQRPYQAALNRAEAAVERADARLAYTKTEVARAEALLERNNISKEQYDLRLQEMRQAQADLTSAKAERRTAELDFEFTEVRAPISGRVSEHAVDVGNLINGGAGNATPLTNIVSLDPIHFVFDASERAFLRYQRTGPGGEGAAQGALGAPVRVKLSDEAGSVHEGTIDFVDNQVDEGTGTIRARAVFENADGALTPGVFGRLQLKGRGPYEAMLLPDKAVVSDQDRKMVYVVGDDQTAQVRPIKLGPMYKGLRVIRSGLAPDDRVIVAGLMFVRPNAPVRPQETTISLTDQ